MMTTLAAIEGIGQAYADKLRAIGIGTVEALLKAAATPVGRQEIADKAGISDKLVLRWANNADLFRVKGISEEYADLLEAAGVDTVPELAQRNPDNLYDALASTNVEAQRVRRLPSRKQVAEWVAQAKVLPRVLTY